MCWLMACLAGRDGVRGRIGIGTLAFAWCALERQTSGTAPLDRMVMGLRGVRSVRAGGLKETRGLLSRLTDSQSGCVK